jgi:hypothetical protein
MPESMKMHEPTRMPDSVPMFEPGKPSERIMPPERIVPPEPARGRPQRAPVAESESQPAVVLPLSRGVRNEQAIRFSQPLQTGGIDRLLRIAAARGASTLYLTSQARPSIRIDGEIGVIEGESVLSEADVEALILDIIPERNRETLRSEPGTEWICDVLDVGRVRCVTFRDHRGAGGIFRMIPARAISAEQLGLSREIQGLCAEAEGLLLITGPRSSGKSTLISAFVDLINRTRSDHVITLETQIKFVHENRLSLVSQREVRGDNTEWMSAARAALRWRSTRRYRATWSLARSRGTPPRRPSTGSSIRRPLTAARRFSLVLPKRCAGWSARCCCESREAGALPRASCCSTRAPSPI